MFPRFLLVCNRFYLFTIIQVFRCAQENNTVREPMQTDSRLSVYGNAGRIFGISHCRHSHEKQI